MQCVLVTKAAYQSLAWPVPFAELVSRAESGAQGFSLVQSGPNPSAEKDHALFHAPNKNGVAYLLFQNW